MFVLLRFVLWWVVLLLPRYLVEEELEPVLKFFCRDKGVWFGLVWFMLVLVLVTGGGGDICYH